MLLAKAFACYKPLAEQGNGKAQYNLGDMYDEGHGVPEDEQQALYWYKKAAEQGDVNAQFRMGVMYELGQGVPRDYGQAVYWYKKAADQGDAEAQKYLAALERLMNQRNESSQHTAQQHQTQDDAPYPTAPKKASPRLCLGVLQQYQYAINDRIYGTECIKIFKNLAENGDVEAEYFFMQRAHSIAGYDEAMYWAKRLADQGDPLIQGYLAKYYFWFPSPWLGIGKKDCHKALYWAEKAIDKELEKGDGFMVLTNIYSWGCDDIKPDPDALRDLTYQLNR
jgi:TPR repeat protein